jgi:hypothetical protein
MAAARGIGVSELVDQHELGATLDNSVEIHFGQQVSPIFYLPLRDNLEALDQRLGLAPAMGFDYADDDIYAVAPPGLSCVQHFESFSDPRRGAEEDLQPAKTLLLRRRQQRLR